MTPTHGELDILKILWREGPQTVRQVNDALNEQRSTGYTTTLKIMQIMHEKGFVGRNEKNRSHVYEARVDENETQVLLLERFLQSAFGGSASKLVMQALGTHKPSKTELNKIKEMIQRIEEERR